MTGSLQQRLLEGFSDAFGGLPVLAGCAPGRVNLIGEHTDYNDGFALPMAIDAATQVAIRPRTDGLVNVVALDFGERDRFPAAEPARSHTGGWRDYVRGALAALESSGVDLAIAGDIPKGTGLSSSASLNVAIVTTMLKLQGRVKAPRAVALLAQRAETEFTGVRCGNLDQLAIAGCVADHALLIDCRSLDLTPVPMPSDWVVMIVQSGVTRGLVEGQYNIRRRQCEDAATALGVSALRDASLADLDALKNELPAVVHRRARHVIGENARVLDAARAMQTGDLRAFGALMKASHVSQRDDFEITVPATDRLVALLDEAIGGGGGARQTGGGFGGAVIAVMRREAVEAVRARLIAHGVAADAIDIQRPGAGATLIALQPPAQRAI